MTPKVMTFVGCNKFNDIALERKKILTIAGSRYKPDIICDVSTFFHKISLVEIIANETNLLPATVPIYHTVFKNKRISAQSMFNSIAYSIKCGAKMLTLHLTPDKELAQLSKSRTVPTTSRGGNLILKYCLSDSVMGNLYDEIFDDIIDICLAKHVTISIGSTFRASNIFDALDSVNRAEISKQIYLAKKLKSQGINTIIEGPGHISPDKIKDFAALVSGENVKIMPLGPIISEYTLNSEHVIASIGATLLGMEIEIENIAAVTDAEHAGGIPTTHQTIVAIKAAKIAAHLISLSRDHDTTKDKEAIALRNKNKSCMQFGTCKRCGNICPLLNR